MAEIANMGYVVDEAQGTDWADGTDETDVAETALRMNTLRTNALFHYDCLGHQELKNRAMMGFGSLML